MARARQSPIPGFRLTLGYMLFYFGLLVLFPLSLLVAKSASGGWGGFLRAVTSPRAVASLRFTLVTSLAAAVINAVFGFILAWVLARYRFPGKRLVDAVVDLPLALPTAVAGVALTALYTDNGWIGSRLAPLGLHLAFAWPGVVIALVFVGLPFLVRTVQPVIEGLDPALEEAAVTLGASPRQTFVRVVLPALAPALRAGFAAAFARAIGEYGSVVFIAGNMPMKTEITSLLIMTKLDQYDYAGAASLGVVMLGISLLLLVVIHSSRTSSERRRALV
ncbi:MAG TPA: sulfate ABC transporter permease subunit CysT [Polyangiaceae bacterium]|jgi:sulfate transport system permease protein|nr:sulfate ABC transporter permease subunit CysT [Polyangiaceae bacterium]